MPRILARKKGKFTLLTGHLATISVLVLAAMGSLYYILFHTFNLQGNASVPGSLYVVYNDSLATGWSDWSWGSKVDMQAFESSLSLNKVIAVNITSKYGGLYLHTDSPQDSNLYDAVEFDVKGGTDELKLGTWMQTSSDQHIGGEVYLANVGGDPQNGSWSHYTIPLSDYSPRFTTAIGGIIIEDELGQANQIFYVDNVKLVASSTVSVTPNPTTTLIPTPSDTISQGITPTSIDASSPTPTNTQTFTPTPTRRPRITPTPTPKPTPIPTPVLIPGKYPWHTKIVSTTFWVGEIFNSNLADGSQVCSTYDSNWAYHWSGINDGKVPSGATACAGSIRGGCDGKGGYTNCQTEQRYASNNYFPNDTSIHPLENPFYLDLPFDDINDSTAFRERCQVIPWANDLGYSGHCTDTNFSYMKNRWVKIIGPNGNTCYGQNEDAGPSHGSLYHDAAYVFGSNDARPIQGQWNDAGMDVSPALNGCLGYKELDGDTDKVYWTFVDDSDVPAGPWKIVVTSSGVSE